MSFCGIATSRTAWLACALLVVRASSALAQSPRVGHIDEVRGVDSTASCARDYALPPPPLSVSLVRGADLRPAIPPDTAVLLDRLRVHRFADVRFRVDGRRFGEGTFFLAPVLGRCARAASNLRLNGLALSANAVGSYRLSSRQERSGGRLVDRLLLSVENGAVVVEWGRGLLSVIALGREIRDSGTVFAVVVDSAANRALLFVRDGLVTMTGVANLQATAGRAFSFGPQGRPQPVTLSQDVIEDVSYHRQLVWTQTVRTAAIPSVGPPARKGTNLWKVLGGVALVGGGGYLIWQQVHKTDASGPYTGNVIIHIPI